MSWVSLGEIPGLGSGEGRNCSQEAAGNVLRHYPMALQARSSFSRAVSNLTPHISSEIWGPAPQLTPLASKLLLSLAAPALCPTCLGDT